MNDIVAFDGLYRKATMPTVVGMDAVLLGGLPQRERQNELTINQHAEDIESLKKEISQKDEEISDLRKAMKDLEERNNDLDIALKSRNEEVKTLKGRITRLESEKKDLEDELASVKVKLARIEKDVKDLGEARMDGEERDLKLEENLGKCSGKMESIKGELKKVVDENQALKKEVKELKEAQHKFPLVVSTGQQVLGPPERMIQAPSELPASLLLGELCRQLQIQMYKIVFPNHFSATRNYKIKNIRYDLEKLPQPEDEKAKSKRKWEDLQAKFSLDKTYEEGIKALQDNRNNDAHPSLLTREALLKSAEIMNKSGSLKGWLSLEFVKRLIEMWPLLRQMDVS